jgi:hypothetical protein
VTNLHILAADIASRIPEMQRDCATNNAALIERMIREHVGEGEQTCHFCNDTITEHNYSYKETVRTPDGVKLRLVCDACWEMVSHEQAVEWCMKNLRAIQR